MSSAIHVEDRTSLRAVADDGPVSTEGRSPSRLKRAAAWIGAASGPAVVGTAVGLLARSARAGFIAGGATGLAVAAVRSQLERLFTTEPDYDVHRRIGPLELRLYTPRIEARTRVDGLTFDDALDEGYRRLASYIRGANASHEELARLTPVIVGREGGYYVAMVMPPGRTIDTLPPPEHERVRLHHVPARRVAVMCFAGGMSHARASQHEQEAQRRIRDAGLHALGIPVHAIFDPPWTLPFLRRNEVWIELGL
jgi:hypothetical protein